MKKTRKIRNLNGIQLKIVVTQILLDTNYLPFAVGCETCSSLIDRQVYMIDVKVHEEEWSIIRRYNQFDDLYQKLRTKYPNQKGMILYRHAHFTLVPWPPKKSYFRSGVDPAIVEKRKEALQDYLQRLIACEFVINSPEFQEWLDPSQDVTYDVN